MSDTDFAEGNKLAEVARLATMVADRILAAQIADRPVPAEQATALLGAARLLQDNEVPWPPLVEQVIHELADRAGEEASQAAEPKPETEGAIAGLTRLLSAFRGEKGQSEGR